MQGNEPALLDFCFFVHDVLAHFRIEFLDFHLSGHGAFVLGRGVEVTGACRRNQFDFIAHGVELLLDLFAASAQIFENSVDAALVYDAHALGGQTQRDKAVLAGHPELVGVKVRQKTAPSSIFSV